LDLLQPSGTQTRGACSRNVPSGVKPDASGGSGPTQLLSSSSRKCDYALNMMRTARNTASRFRRHALRLLVRIQGRILVLPTERVDWIEAAGVYVRLHTPDSQPLIRRSMNELEQRLDPDRFIRIHRSAIINVDRLHDLQPLTSGDFEVTLLDGTRLVLSRRYRHRVAEALGEPI